MDGNGTHIATTFAKQNGHAMASQMNAFSNTEMNRKPTPNELGLAMANEPQNASAIQRKTRRPTGAQPKYAVMEFT